MTLTQPDRASMQAVARRAEQVLRPTGAFARLDEVAAWLAGWQRTSVPKADRSAVVVFAADHGVATDGVSAYPASVTPAMLDALRRGVATASVMAEAVGASMKVVDVGVGRPTGNIRTEAALDDARFDESWRAGVDAVAELEADVVVLGEMGIGNTTPAAAVAAALFGGPAEEWTGRGTGVDDQTYTRKIGVVAEAVARVGDADALTVLRELGGAELVAMAAACAEARRRSIPMILDGFVVTAACATLEVAEAGSLDHCIAGHCSGESGHRLLLSKLGKEPLLDLGLRLGEGSGAIAAIPLVRLAAACVTDVPTFDEFGL